jgi:predicted murein hydrolase (TIGR00659 family)
MSFVAYSFGLILTLLAWWLATRIRRRWDHPAVNPVLLAVTLIVLLLLTADIPFDDYAPGGRILQFFLGPSVVAMAVPVYRYRDLLRSQWRSVTAALVVGCLVSITSAAGLMLWLEGDGVLMRSIAPKSVTAPIAIELSKSIGGEPGLTSAIVILTGILGAVVGVTVLRWVRVSSSIPLGVAMGVAGHGIATASLTSDPMARMAASLGMVLNGVLTSVALPAIVRWMTGG